MSTKLKKYFSKRNVFKCYIELFCIFATSKTNDSKTLKTNSGKTIKTNSSKTIKINKRKILSSNYKIISASNLWKIQTNSYKII